MAYIDDLEWKYSLLAGEIENAREFENPFILWYVANEVRKIICSNEYKKVFRTQAEFAKYIGLSNSRISQYVAASKFAEQYHINCDIYSVTRVYDLSLLKDDYPDFVEFAKKKNANLARISNAKLRKLEEAFRTNGCNVKNSVVRFELDGVTYEVPKNVLELYRVIK